MNVLLASLSVEDESRFPHHADYAYPLGLAYLHAMLEQENHNVKTLALNNYNMNTSYQRIFSVIKEWKPDVIGFQVFSMNRTATYLVMEKILIEFPGIRIVLGGIHASVMFQQLIERYPKVVIVIGEAEITICELMRAFEYGTSLKEIEGITFWQDNHVVVTNPRPLIKDLDTLPFPKHEIFFEQDPKRKMAHMITSRGCPFKCSFCCLHNVTQRKWRTRSPQKVVDELKWLKKSFPSIHSVQFHDDTLTLDSKRTDELCRLLIRENLSLKLICSARVKPSSREMFLLMKKAGFTKIMFGLETGSRTLLESIHKNIKPEDVIKLFENIRGIDFDITTFLMCGFPGENNETIAETIDLVRKTQKINYNYIQGVGKLFVYPGTEIYEIMKKAGSVNDEFWLSHEPVPFFTVEHSLSELKQYEEKIMVNVSIDRIFSINGFMSQMPHFWKEIMMYFIKNPRHLLYIIGPRRKSRMAWQWLTSKVKRVNCRT
jgi:anaerobic magnesium-protoporphyrin IX monomethyl ester cyclase